MVGRGNHQGSRRRNDGEGSVASLSIVCLPFRERPPQSKVSRDGITIISLFRRNVGRRNVAVYPYEVKL